MTTDTLPPLLAYAERANVALDYLRPGTSQRAALEAAKMAGPNFLKVIEALIEKPRTPDEISRVKGLVLNTARARCSNLLNPRHPDTGARIAPFVVIVGAGRTDADHEANRLRLATPEERANWKPSDPTDGGGE